MSDLRIWILTLAAVTFFAGVATGVIVVQASEPAEEAPFADFERRFADEFGIEGRRLDHLRTILANYQREVKRVEAGHLAAIREQHPTWATRLNKPSSLPNFCAPSGNARMSSIALSVCLLMRSCSFANLPERNA